MLIKLDNENIGGHLTPLHLPKIILKNWWMRITVIASQTWEIFGGTA